MNWNRANQNKANSEPEQIDASQPEQPQPEQRTRTQPEQAYTLVPDFKVYGRQSVVYLGDTFTTRPVPDDPTDTPCPRNRCKYARRDGSEYMIDACGQGFDKINGQYQPEVMAVAVL